MKILSGLFPPQSGQVCLVGNPQLSVGVTVQPSKLTLGSRHLWHEVAGTSEPCGPQYGISEDRNWMNGWNNIENITVRHPPWSKVRTLAF